MDKDPLIIQVSVPLFSLALIDSISCCLYHPGSVGNRQSHVISCFCKPSCSVSRCYAVQSNTFVNAVVRTYVGVWVQVFFLAGPHKFKVHFGG